MCNWHGQKKTQEILNVSLADIDASPVVLNQDIVVFHVVGTFNGNSYDQHQHQPMIAALFMVLKQIICKHWFSEARRFTTKLAILKLVIIICGCETAEEQIFYESVKRRAMETIGMQ